MFCFVCFVLFCLKNTSLKSGFIFTLNLRSEINERKKIDNKIKIKIKTSCKSIVSTPNKLKYLPTEDNFDKIIVHFLQFWKTNKQNKTKQNKTKQNKTKLLKKGKSFFKTLFSTFLLHFHCSSAILSFGQYYVVLRSHSVPLQLACCCCCCCCCCGSGGGGGGGGGGVGAVGSEDNIYHNKN